MQDLWKSGSFTSKIMALDAALTGKENVLIQHNMRSHMRWADPIYWATEAIYDCDFLYLSDGGYSRIGFSLETRKIYLTSNSLDKPKQHWDNCKELRADIEDEINAALEKNGNEKA